MRALFMAAVFLVVSGIVIGDAAVQNDFILKSAYAAEMQSVAGSSDRMTAIGYGYLPAGMPVGRAKLMARRAAIVDAQRNLVEIIKGTAVDAETSMENYLVTSDIVKTKVNGMVTGARIVAEKLDADGSYEVTMEVPMYGVGSVSDVAINAIVGDSAPVPVPAPNPAFVQIYNQISVNDNSFGSGYTGVVIDAQNSGILRTFCPAVYDTKGRAVYGVNNVDKNFAVNNGIVEYAEGSEQWSRVTAGTSRAGANPLVIKIVGLRERVVNKCDVIISEADADKLLTENQRSHFLDRYAVVFEK